MDETSCNRRLFVAAIGRPWRRLPDRSMIIRSIGAAGRMAADVDERKVPGVVTMVEAGRTRMAADDPNRAGPASSARRHDRQKSLAPCDKAGEDSAKQRLDPAWARLHAGQAAAAG